MTMTDAERWMQVAMSIEADIKSLEKAVAIYRGNAESGTPWSGLTEEDVGCFSGTSTRCA